ncbi:hypothetical protein [Pseudomonas sp. NPDC090201]|uniref:hypothetical protein n=1 Tax=Pseudomonas sp. NPDC090201 TaxID=3364475 RepID=UPI003802E888
MSESKGLVKASIHLVGHIAVGTVMFAIVAGVATALELFVHWLQTMGASETLVDVLGRVERLLLVLDVGLFVIMLLGATWKFIREIWTEATEK